MKICGVCGLTVQQDHAFCLHCGRPLVPASAPSPAAPHPPAGPVAPPDPAPGAAQATDNVSPPDPASGAAPGESASTAASAPEGRHAPPAATMMMPQVTPALAKARFRLTVTQPNGRPGPAVVVEDALIAGAAGSLPIEGDAHVAEEHAFFGLHDGAVEVTELQGSNGIWLALTPNDPVRLRPGGRLRLGSQILELQPVKPVEASSPRVWGTKHTEARVRLLQHLDGGGQGAAWLLGEGDWIIGREGASLSFTDDDFMSARHGLLTVSSDGSTSYEDLGSSNGSYIAIMETTRLQAGDRLLIGGHLFRVEQI